MPFRLPVITNNQTIERGTATSVTLGVSTQVSTTGMTPKSSNGQSIAGLLLKIDADIIQPTAKSWNVGQLFGGMTIIKGGQSNVRLALSGYEQLVRLFNSLTRLTDSATMYFNNKTNTGAAGASTQTLRVFLPLEYKTDDVIPQTIITFNPLSVVDATSGSVTTTITYCYTANNVRDDVINIVTSPTSLNAKTDIDVSTLFAGSTVQDEIWMDTGTDENLNYQTFRYGNSPVYPMIDAFAMRAHTNPSIVTQPIDGFYLLKVPVTSYPANGVSGTKPIIDINFATTITPTFYLYSKL